MNETTDANRVMPAWLQCSVVLMKQELILRGFIFKRQMLNLFDKSESVFKLLFLTCWVNSDDVIMMMALARETIYLSYLVFTALPRMFQCKAAVKIRRSCCTLTFLSLITLFPEQSEWSCHCSSCVWCRWYCIFSLRFTQGLIYFLLPA